MFREAQIFSLFWLVAASVIFVYSFQYEPSSRYFPMLASGMTVLLCAVDILLRWRKHKPEDDKQNKPVMSYAFLRMVGWLLLLLLGLKFVTYLMFIPLFVFMLLWLEAKERWYVALSIGAGLGVFIYCIFIVLLKATF